MNYIISSLIGVALAIVGALGGWFSGEKVFDKQPEQLVGVFSDPFISLQLATDPTNGECLTTDGTNNVWSTSCGTGGGGSGGGTMSTTTSTVPGQLTNSPNNATDILVIGSNSTTTGEYWFDPNVQRAYLSGRVGIGTTNPTATLQVGSSTSQGVFQFNSNTGGASIYSGVGQPLYMYDTSGNIIARFVNTGAMYLRPNSSTDAVAILSNGSSYFNGGNVGIGTTSPPSKLTVQGSGTGHVLLGEWAANSAYGAVSLNGSLATGDANFYSSLSDRNFYINRPSGRGIFFSENNGNSQLVIASGGNVGVGTSSPNAKLSITGNGTSAILAGDAGFSNCSSLKLGDGSPMTTTNYHLTSCAADQGLYVNVPTNRGIYFRINNVDTMTLASSSTLGLGTTLPTEKFHIKQTNDGGNVAIRIQNSSTNSGSTASLKFTVTSNDAYNITEIRSVRSPSNELVFLTDDAERLRINSTGVGVGTSSPYAKLSVVGNVVASNFIATSTTATSTFFGGVDTSSARVKTKVYPSFSFPSGINSATTTTATTTIAIGTAFVSQQYSTAECFTGSGTVGYRVTDGTNAMDYELATTTVSRFTLSSNNTFQVSEKRFVEIGPMTTSYLSCTFDVTQNY